MLLGAQLVLLALTALLCIAARAERPRVALAAFLVPVSLTAPPTVVQHLKNAEQDFEHGPARAALFASPAAARGRNLPLLRAAQTLIPPTSVYGIVRRRPANSPAHERRARSSGIVWMQFQLAPRIADRGDEAQWILIFDSSPRREGIAVRRAWRFGEDWLVRR